MGRAGRIGLHGLEQGVLTTGSHSTKEKHAEVFVVAPVQHQSPHHANHEGQEYAGDVLQDAYISVEDGQQGQPVKGHFEGRHAREHLELVELAHARLLRGYLQTGASASHPARGRRWL